MVLAEHTQIVLHNQYLESCPPLGFGLLNSIVLVRQGSKVFDLRRDMRTNPISVLCVG